MIRVTTLAAYSDDQGNLIEYDGSATHNVRVKFKGANNRLRVAADAKLLDLVVDFDCDNGTVEIGGNTAAPALVLAARIGQDSTVRIGANVSSTSKCYVSAVEGTTISIGDDVMFATGNEVRTDDGHPIFDVRSGRRVNVSKSIQIGDHVWFGKDAVVLAGGRVGAGSIVGYGGVVTAPLPNNCIAVGVPARVIRRDVAWERPHLSLARPYYKPDASTVRRSPYWHLTTDGDGPPRKAPRYTPSRIARAVLRRARRGRPARVPSR